MEGNDHANTSSYNKFESKCFTLIIIAPEFENKPENQSMLSKQVDSESSVRHMENWETSKTISIFCTIRLNITNETTAGQCLISISFLPLFISGDPIIQKPVV